MRLLEGSRGPTVSADHIITHPIRMCLIPDYYRDNYWLNLTRNGCVCGPSSFPAFTPDWQSSKSIFVLKFEQNLNMIRKQTCALQLRGCLKVLASKLEPCWWDKENQHLLGKQQICSFHCCYSHLLPGQMQEVTGSRFDGPGRTIIIIEVVMADP